MAEFPAASVLADDVFLDQLLTEIKNEVGDGVLVIRPGEKFGGFAGLPHFIIIDDRHDAGPDVFDKLLLDRVPGAAALFVNERAHRLPDPKPTWQTPEWRAQARKFSRRRPGRAARQPFL